MYNAVLLPQPKQSAKLVLDFRSTPARFILYNDRPIKVRKKIVEGGINRSRQPICAHTRRVIIAARKFTFYMKFA